jgi:hypothetical protein
LAVRVQVKLCRSESTEGKVNRPAQTGALAPRAPTPLPTAVFTAGVLVFAAMLTVVSIAAAVLPLAAGVFGALAAAAAPG